MNAKGGDRMQSKGDQVIPPEEFSNCSFCIRHTFTAANWDNPFLYYATYAGHYEALEHYQTDRRDFESLIVLYTESGEAALSVDGGPLLTMRPGSVMVLDCRRHHLYYPTESPWSFYYLHVVGRDCLTFPNSLAHPERPIYEYSSENRMRIRSMLEKALSMPDEISLSLDLQVSSLIYQLFMALLDRSGDLPDGEALENLDKLRLAERYMQEHLGEPITAEDLAGRLYLSRPYFSTLFRRYYGIPPHQYLTALRISRAKQLLIGTDQSIGEIAQLVGYEDFSAFSRSFSRLTGMTPRQFREIR